MEMVDEHKVDRGVYFFHLWWDYSYTRYILSHILLISNFCQAFCYYLLTIYSIFLPKMCLYFPFLYSLLQSVSRDEQHSVFTKWCWEQSHRCRRMCGQHVFLSETLSKTQQDLDPFCLILIWLRKHKLDCWKCLSIILSNRLFMFSFMLSDPGVIKN